MGQGLTVTYVQNQIEEQIKDLKKRLREVEEECIEIMVRITEIENEKDEWFKQVKKKT